MPLTNSQYDEIQRQYDARQLRNQHYVQSQKSKLFALQPRLKEIEDGIAASSVRHAELLLDGDQNALDSLREELNSYRRERKQIYDALGINERELEPPYICPDCKDTGQIEGHNGSEADFAADGGECDPARGPYP